MIIKTSPCLGVHVWSVRRLALGLLNCIVVRAGVVCIIFLSFVMYVGVDNLISSTDSNFYLILFVNYTIVAQSVNFRGTEIVFAPYL